MRRIIGIIFLCCFCLVVSPLVTDSKAEAASKGNLLNDITWKISDNGTLTMSGKGRIQYDVSLPSYKEAFRNFNKRKGKVKKIVVSKGITGFDTEIFGGCYNVTSITVPGTVKTIPKGAFSSKKKLKTITLKEGVKRINQDAFSGCENLKTLNLPNSLETIGKMAFYDTGITELKLPKGVKTISDAAFGNCKMLKYADISKGVTYIGDFVFRECSNLVTVTFCDKLNYLGSDIFCFCEQKINVCFKGRAPKFQKDTFSNNIIVALYPKNNTTWTESKRKNYKNTYCVVTWKSYNPKVFGRPSITINNVASSGKNKISWDMVPGAHKYEVYRATKKDGKYTKLVTTRLLHLVNTSGKAEKKYFYKVRAIKQNGKKSSFSYVKSNYVDLPRPGAPTITQDSSDGKPILTWKTVSGADSYHVYKYDYDVSKYKLIGKAEKNSYKDIDAEVISGLTYKIEAVSEKHSDSNSALGPEGKGKCVCATPMVEIKQDETSGQPALSWSSIEYAVQYRIFRAEGESGEYSLLAKTGKTNYIDQTAETGKTYSYKVIAKKSKTSSMLDSKESNVVIITVMSQQ